MNDELKAHREPLGDIVAAIHRATATVAVLSFVGYGVAAWLWFSGQPWLALGVATVSYLFFRLYPVLSVHWARWRSADDLRARAALEALERAWQGRSRRAVLLEVDAWLRKEGSKHD
ncbi:hypothetical protein [Acidihalobacter ferrooxydans]|uniref:Uncharacterized protein n=1 Tax=Acidihalobacter ferrooxydans TaxID=1765967 RepID=A0A1P8UIH5_9GAMM|nr:hypothetical protein [Acidihalobacter ferrooxydans]APZ43636.1 hypothetical protein BW247_11515 [Acidihalobacter ferrooxydans]